jgi:hypothetical protein
MTSESGSFARRTIVERQPQILRQVLEDNDYPADIVRGLDALEAEVGCGPIRPLTENADDVDFWNNALELYKGRTWLEASWFFAETYFYRRLLEAVRYLPPGPWQGRDPFWRRKRRLEQDMMPRFDEAWRSLIEAEPDVALEALLHSSLWGNRADLSNNAIRVQARGGLCTRDERHNVLIDDTDVVRDQLKSGLRVIAFATDNAGVDVLCDLALSDFLLAQGWTTRVEFHVKDRPFFVSDAMPEDIGLTLARLTSAQSRALNGLGERLSGCMRDGRLCVRTHPFWTRCLSFREMPLAVRAGLARADLVVLKGDVNYRRLLADRHWPDTTPLSAAAGDFPRPFLVLRTLKGELMVGLAAGQADRLMAEDREWMINGQRGVIQLVAT